MKDLPKRQLLINYLLGLCTPREEQEVERWLHKEPGNSALLQEIAKEIGRDGTLPEAEKEDIKKEVINNLDSPNDSAPQKSVVRNKRKFTRATGWWLKIAAAVLLILFAGGFGLYYSSTTTSIDKKAKVTFNKQTLSAGQKATFRFGDGSVIKLNSESTLRYPSKFSSEKREVYLEGEAFFSIERDTTRPFIIHAGGTATRVMGTAFNIRAYESEGQIQVAVTEGKVAVSKEKTGNSSSQESIHITKDQWLTYRPASQLMEKGEGNIRQMVAWKDKILIFKDEPLNRIANQLERWYNIDISLADSSLVNRRMSATFEDETMSEVLTTIALSLNLEYEREGKEIVFQNNS